MRRHERLRRRRDLDALYRAGRVVSGDLLVVRARRNALDHNRYAFAVGTRVGKAVVRNRLKRRLRAAVAALLPARRPQGTGGGWDVLIIARAPAAAADYHGLVAALARLLRRARLLPADGGAGGAQGREAVTADGDDGP
jgi:ribonuclease P protein component